MNHQAEKSPMPGKRRRRSSISSSGDPNDLAVVTDDPQVAGSSIDVL
jgi:hypothetical protein